MAEQSQLDKETGVEPLGWDVVDKIVNQKKYGNLEGDKKNQPFSPF